MIEFPIPDYRHTVDRFLATWAGSDPRQIVEFFAPDGRAEMLETLQSMIDKRGWKQLPPIQNTDLNQSDDTHVQAVHTSPRGEITVRWYYDLNGHWRISTLKLPAS